VRREQRLLLARSELARVSRLEGYPEGVAVGVRRYNASPHRSMTDWQLSKLVMPSRRAPAWGEVVHRLGFMTFREWQRAEYMAEDAVIGDVMRVSRKIGQGRCATFTEYRKHGRYHYRTVFKSLGVTDWAGVVEKTNLRPWFDRSVLPNTLQELVDAYVRANESLGIRRGGRGIGYKRFGRIVGYNAHIPLRKFLNGTRRWSRFVRACGFTCESSDKFFPKRRAA